MFVGGLLGLLAFGLGALSFACGSLRREDAFLFSFAVVFSFALVEDALLFGGVKERNPSLELEFALAASEAGTRASLGDMAGAWYSKPADRADTAEWLLKSPALAVAATAGRP